MVGRGWKADLNWKMQVISNKVHGRLNASKVVGATSSAAVRVDLAAD